MSPTDLKELFKLTPQPHGKWTDKSKRKLCEAVSAFQPEFRKLMARNLHSGEGFPEDLDVLARLATHAAENHPDLYANLRRQQIETSQMMGMQWDNACKYGIPLSRIEASTFRLILDCQAPVNTPLWTEQTTPKFPTQFYIPPKGMLEVEGEPIILIGLTCWTSDQRKTEETELCNKINLRLTNPTIDNKGLIVVVGYTNGHGEYYTRQPIIDDVIQESKKFIDHSQTGATTAEMEFSAKLLSIGMQLLLLENTYPEWHTPEKEIKTTTGGGRQLREFRPKLIGGNFPHRNKFTLNTRVQDDEARKRPCEHWRGAHWKTVHYGIQNSLTKRKLILPYLVNPGFD